jgi:hypothetical protein
VLLRDAPAATPRAEPVVLVVPVLVQSSSQSISMTASLLPALPWESPSASTRDSLRVSHPPLETVHFAVPVVADSGVRFAAAFLGVPAFPAPALSAPPLWPAFVVLLAEPLHVVAQSNPAAATTSPDESSMSTELDVPQSPLHCDRPLPLRRVWSVAALPVTFLVPASWVAERSLPDPFVRVSHEPPPVPHEASEPSGVAMLR